MIVPIQGCPDPERLTEAIKSVYHTFASFRGFLDSPADKNIYYGEDVHLEVEGPYYHLISSPHMAGINIGRLMSIAVKASKIRALKNDNVVTDAEIFLINFYDTAFGMKLSFADCHADTSDIGAVISRALENVSDYKDMAQWIEAATEVAEHKEEFELAFRDCPNTLGVLREGALLFKSL